MKTITTECGKTLVLKMKGNNFRYYSLDGKDFTDNSTTMFLRYKNENKVCNMVDDVEVYYKIKKEETK